MQTSPSTQSKNLLSGLHFGAILVGALTDIISTNIVAFCYGIIPMVMMARSLAGQGLSPQEIQSRLMNNMTNSIPIFIIGCLTTVLGGYVAALIAKRSYVLNGLGSGLGVLVLGLVTNALCGSFFRTAAATASALPLWRTILGIFITPGLSALGGYLMALQARGRTGNVSQSVEGVQ